MLRALFGASLVLIVAGCAHAPPQINRAAKADKYVAPKAMAPAPMPTPNQIVKKRWMPKFRIHWLHK